MSTEPTDPTTAAATIRRAATAMRDAAGAAYPGPWISDESLECWRLHSAPDPNWPSAQILKAPKYGTPYAEYWPDKPTSEHIVSWHPGVTALVADVLDALANDIDEVLTDHGGNWFGPVPAEWTATYNLAAAFLERRPQ